MTKDEYVHMRIDKEEKNMLRQMAERQNIEGMSELVRILIRYVYAHQDWFDFYMEKHLDIKD